MTKITGTYHSFVQDVDGDACVVCGCLESSPVHHKELIGHVVGEGGKCWCGTRHENYHPPLRGTTKHWSDGLALTDIEYEKVSRLFT